MAKQALFARIARKKRLAPQLGTIKLGHFPCAFVTFRGEAETKGCVRLPGTAELQLGIVILISIWRVPDLNRNTKPAEPEPNFGSSAESVGHCGTLPYARPTKQVV
jgi:hypothetical protein